MKNHIISFLAALALTSTLAPALPITTTIDLGPNGTYDEVAYALPDLTGLPVDGASHAVTIDFLPGQFGRLWTSTDSSFSAYFRLETGHSGTPGFVTGTGWLVDVAGDPLQTPKTLVSFSSSAGVMTTTLMPYSSLTLPVDFYGVHYEITLPDEPGVSVTGARLTLLNGPFGIGNVGGPVGVPDGGATGVLLAVGLAVVGVARKLKGAS